MRTFILTALFLLSQFYAAAQQCGGPGREPDKANAVCGYKTFNQGKVYSCSGPDIPNPTSGCGQVTSANSIWYKFHCYQDGTFGFLLNPALAVDDYDWEIMDVTGHAPTDVYTMELRVSLNLSGQTGQTGCTATATSNINCGGGAAGTQYNKLLNLVAGHDYLMMVNNWTNSQLGYTLVFSGTAVLTNTAKPLPEIASVAIVGCDASRIKVTFSEDILCNSISSAVGSEFTVTAGTHTIGGIISDCTSGANGVPSVIVSLQAPLAPGGYNLNVADGVDNNTLKNVCDELMLPVSVPFTVPVITPVQVDVVSFTSCAPKVLDVKLTKPVWCSSVTAQGTEFTIMPGNIPVIATVADCTGAPDYATMLHLSVPNQLPYGNYQLVIKDGIDNNSVIDTCGFEMADVTIPFTINQTTVAPKILPIVFDECKPKTIVINFDKAIACSSIGATYQEFTITPSAGPFGINYSCNANTTTQVTLLLQNPIPAGNFTLTIGNGMDGNTIGDTCFSFMPNGYTANFVTTKAPAPKFDSVQFDKCNPSTLRLFYSKAIRCSSVSADGTDYNITGPSTVIINNAVTDVTCADGYTNWVLLQLTNPITTFGNYVIHNKVGSDATGIIDTCMAVQNTAETIGFTALVKPSAVFTSQITFGCKTDQVTFSHPGGNGINTWTWTFEDGSTASGQTVTHSFPVSTVITKIKLEVSNGSCNDIVTQEITLDNAFDAAFTQNPIDTTCINTAVSFAEASVGKNLQYLWKFGDNTQFVGQNPPPHTYTTSGLFNINLIVTDPYGCLDTAVSKIYITPQPTVDFTGLAPQYCNDKTITLTRQISNSITNYVWDNGDGVTVTNKPVVQFTYAKEGGYTITLTGTDKFCTGVKATKTVNIFAVPNFALGNDTVLCPSMPLEIGVQPTTGYTYLWSNGASTPKIFTDVASSTYSLSIDNNGCKATDAIAIKVLGACLIKVPNAFTPNGDNVNDLLRATNADLAKEFSLKVFNRYGELIYNGKNPVEGWNGYYKGIRAPSGAYIWQLSYIDPWTQKKVFESGSSLLIR